MSVNDDSENRRARQNKEVLARMRSGNLDDRADIMESWYPIRPKIEKDPEALNRLYGTPEQQDKPKANLSSLFVVK